MQDPRRGGGLVGSLAAEVVLVLVLEHGEQGGRVVLGHVGRWQAGCGVVGHQLAQVRRNAARRWHRLGRGRRRNRWGDRHRAATAVGVRRLVERQDHREVGATARIDQIDRRQVPAYDAQTDPSQGAISPR